MLPSLSPVHAKLCRHWLLLSIGALALAGVFSILLVLLRTPSIQAMIPYHDFFRTALIVHVDLSVLVWMLAMSAMLWSMIMPGHLMMVGHTGFYLALVGTIAIAVSPFIGESNPLLNNYIPVLQNPLFFLGLSLFGCGILFQAVSSVLHIPSLKHGMVFGIYSSALITLIALLCFVLSHINLRNYLQHSPLEIQHFYELLFWSGGHILQFTYTQGMILAWFILAVAIGSALQIQNKGLLLGINLLIVLPMPLVMLFYTIDSSEYITYFTDHMRHAGGIATLFAGVVLLATWIKNAPSFRSPLGASLLCSILLFTAGGILAHMIRGANVIIPAHYHGSIVGVTLAFMGLAYYMLPRLGYGEAKSRMALLQPYIYGGGQFLHISGLAWSGGYGALRKTPGEVLSIEAKAGMALMGLGGLIAIIGGIVFVIVALNSIRTKQPALSASH
jgi:cytochrome c oxidase subunit I